ncbi:MAG TPA: hypothetical protein P5230_00605 [Candidatus Magasanikbacteria bacterium]|nr:hypothetical protein [Candidatus Magasanikbacteria bacterium]
MIDKIVGFKNKTNYFLNEIRESTVFFLRMPGWLFGVRGRLCLVAVNLILVVAFVLQIAAASGTGYELKKLERNIEEISFEQQKIEAQIAEVNSLASLKSRVESLSMVNTPRLKYLAIPVTSVAVNSR